MKKKLEFAVAKPEPQAIKILRFPRTGIAISYLIEDEDLSSLPEALTIQIKVGDKIKRWDLF